MNTLALLSLSLAVALGMPPFAPGVAQNPVMTEEDQSPVQGDWVPEQGHVLVEDPLPQVRLSSKEQQEKLAPVPVDTEQSQSMVEPEVKVKPEVKKDLEVKAETGVKPESEVKVEQEGKEKPEVKVEQELKADPEIRPELVVKVEPKVKIEPEGKVEPEVEMVPELKDDPGFKVELEVKVEPDVQEETEPEVKHVFNEEEVQEKFQVQITLEPETETGQEFKERHIDMERKYEMVGEAVMELEPLDDNSMFGEKLSNKELLEVERSVRAEEEGLVSKQNYVLDGEPIVELEPETRGEPFLYHQVTRDTAIVEEGPALDSMGKQRPSLEEYFPNEEAWVDMEPGKQQGSLTAEELDFLMMEEPGREFVREEALAPVLEDSDVLHGGVQIGVMPLNEKREDRQATRWSCSTGMALEGKCYQFFKGPNRAAEAEFFCQERFPGGHLASITSQHIHKEVMNMMLKQNGAYTRAWIGGLRYLKTGRFIWLDGSHWDYADWLSGEPNNTADVEDCVEVLSHGNGKFNDFTCWERQAFICSHPH